MLNRREAMLGAAAAAVVLGGKPANAQPQGAKPARGKAKRVILVVSDGMSIGTASLADQYSRRVLGRPTAWLGMMNRPDVRRGMCWTSASNSMVTDSAAAATAWSIGQKVFNGSICYVSETEEATPILDRVADAGLGTGVVSTTRITHATPAAFYSRVPRRAMEGPIAEQLLTGRVDVALGGGQKHFEGFEAPPNTAMVGPGKPLPAAGSADRLVALTHDDHVPYVLDRDDGSKLETMAQLAVEHLDIKRPGGWMLQVEQGRVDHAAHENDAPSLIMEQLEFDRTVEAMAAYADARDDTLLVVTSDHGNANPGLTLYGRAGEQGLDKIPAAKQSTEWMVAELGSDRGNASRVREVVEAGYGLDLGNERAEELAAELANPQALFRAHHKASSSIGAAAANDFGISFVSPNHTSDLVLATAQGPGSEALPALLDNTELHGILLGALGVEAANG